MNSMEEDLLKLEMAETLKQAEDTLNQIHKDTGTEGKARVIELAPQTADMFARCLSSLKPPPELTLSQWADMYRMLSAESSAAPGRWHTDNAPYQREIMDAMGDPHVRKVVIMTAAQIGKTAMLMNLLGYYMHYYPAPVLVIQPTLDMAQAFSKDFLAPMLRDTPALRGLVDTKSRYSGNTILKKNFPGGHVTIIGANSAAGLRMRPIKVILADEVDAYPPSAGTEGDPLLLAQKRQTTFWDKKTIIVSTPTIKGHSRIETEFLKSTQEEWTVPCPGCGHYQPLVWRGIKYDKDDLTKPIMYECERCGEVFGEYEWKKQGKKGKFRAENLDAEARGFHLNTLSSSFCGWKEVVEKFVLADEQRKQGDLEKLKTWTNTEDGRTWEEPGTRIDGMELFNRREIYDAEVPEGVIVLTAGVDVQKDRFEVEVVGWGTGKESWGIRYTKIWGDVLKEQAWEDLDHFLLSPFYKKDGTALYIACTCIDSGYQSNTVCSFAKERTYRRVFAVKGKGGMGIPYIPKETRSNREGAPLFTLGVDAGKTLLFQRLKVRDPGPNYCHFPINEEAGYNEDYFTGLTAEQMVNHWRKGVLVSAWVPREGSEFKRNEPLDLRDYAQAAMEILGPDILKAPASEEKVEKQKRRATRRRGGFSGIA